MATKLLSALLLLLVASAAAASAHTTVVTTTTVEEEGNARDPWSMSCATEILEKMPMRRCMMWMESMIMGGPRADAFLRSAAANTGGQYSEEYLEECCGELKMFTSGCRCEAIRSLAQTVQRFGPMEQMQRIACSLPDRCGIAECPCARGRRF